jgi:hypothetical protein
METISFLIGSGFSVPATYPTTTLINERLKKIKADEICVHTSRDAFFLNGKSDPNASWMGVEERKFVEEFLEFYNKYILSAEEEFHYETFYDYYITAYSTSNYSDELNKFLMEFRERNKTIMSAHSLLGSFHDIFSQLLSQMLTKPIEHVHICRPYYPNYRNFLFLLEELSKSHRIHIHTLNHDIYLESLSLTDCIQGNLSDGFDELGSRIYAKVYEKYASYMVRLSRFTGKYDHQFCLYKLHGSIDHYSCNFEDGSDIIKLPWGISPHEIHKEIDRNGKLQYTHQPSDVVPEFLSGTTHKLSRYEIGIYYPGILNNFKNNLKYSKNLIVIGYGFADSRINEYLENYFLADSSKVMFIVDIRKPDIEFINNSNVHYIGGGVTDMDYKKIVKNMVT